MSPAQFLKGDTKIKSWYDENRVNGLITWVEDVDW
jgi:hypothetical protein